MPCSFCLLDILDIPCPLYRQDIHSCLLFLTPWLTISHCSVTFVFYSHHTQVYKFASHWWAPCWYPLISHFSFFSPLTSMHHCHCHFLVSLSNQLHTDVFMSDPFHSGFFSFHGHLYFYLAHLSSLLTGYGSPFTQVLVLILNFFLLIWHHDLLIIPFHVVIVTQPVNSLGLLRDCSLPSALSLLSIYSNSIILVWI